MDAYRFTKMALALRGQSLAEKFLILNGITVPKVALRSLRPYLTKGKPSGSYGCGVYSPFSRTVLVSPEDCARVSPGLPMQWSFPGYTTDRTAMGVMAHEHGHYVDHALGYPSNLAEWKGLRSEKISSYEPNGSEAFAESFRVFLLNPPLLKIVAPRRFEFLTVRLGLKPIFAAKDPLKLLKNRGASDKIIAAAVSKVAKHSKAAP